MSTYQEVICSVCFERIGDSASVLPCGHELHISCYRECKRYNIDSCPLCRTQVILPEKKKIEADYTVAIIALFLGLILIAKLYSKKEFRILIGISIGIFVATLNG